MSRNIPEKISGKSAILQLTDLYTGGTPHYFKYKKKIINGYILKCFIELIDNIIDHNILNEDLDPSVYIYFDLKKHKYSFKNNINYKNFKNKSNQYILDIILNDLHSSGNYKNRKNTAGLHGIGLKLVVGLSDNVKGTLSIENKKQTITTNITKINDPVETDVFENSICFTVTNRELEEYTIEYFLNNKIPYIINYFKFVTGKKLKIYINNNIFNINKELITFKQPCIKKIGNFIFIDNNNNIFNGFYYIEISEKNKNKSLYVINGSVNELNNKSFLLEIQKKILYNCKLNIVNTELLIFDIYLLITCTNIKFHSQKKNKIAGEFKIDFFDDSGFIQEITKKYLINKESKELSKKVKNQSNYYPSTNKNKKLYICEGESAKNNIVNIIKKNKCHDGVLALRGIIPNVLSKKVELNDITKQLYQYISAYKKIVLFTDSDPDGYHILILLYGFILKYFPNELNKIFVIDSKKYFCPNLNILTDENKCNKKNCVHQYLKGIGSLNKELLTKQLDIEKEIFVTSKLSNIIKKILSSNSTYRSVFLTNSIYESAKILEEIDYNENIENDDNCLMSTLETEQNSLTEDELYMISKIQEYIKYKTSRTIPSLIDGLTTVTRKIIYCLLEKNYKGTKGMLEIFGDIYKDMNYHHGDASLIESMFILSSEFVGGLNLCPLISKSGQGTRIKFGKDHPKARYASVTTNKIFIDLFLTDELYEFKYDGNKKIEPIELYPLLPIILINGCRGGLGFGVRCNILPHDPIKIFDLIYDRLTNKINKFDYPPVFFKGFEGNIKTKDVDKNKFVIIKPKYIFDDGLYYYFDQNPMISITRMSEIIEKKFDETEYDISNKENSIYIFKQKTDIMSTSIKMIPNLFINNKLKYIDSNIILETFYQNRLEQFKKYKEKKINDKEIIRNKLENKLNDINFILSEIEAGKKITDIKIQNQDLLYKEINDPSKIIENINILINEIESLKNQSPESIWLEKLETWKFKHYQSLIDYLNKPIK